MSSFSDMNTKSEEDCDPTTFTDSFVDFKPFSSFKNTYVMSEVDYIKQHVPDHEQWVALEKVHGCNFSATTK